MSLRRAVGVCSGPSTSGPTRPATATRLCVGCWCLKESPPGPHPEGGRVAGDRGNTVMSKARRYPTCSDRSNTHRAILPLGRGVAPPLPPSGRAAPTTDRVTVTSPRDVDIVLKSDCSGLANRSGTGDSDGESAPAPGLSVPPPGARPAGPARPSRRRIHGLSPIVGPARSAHLAPPENGLMRSREPGTSAPASSVAGIQHDPRTPPPLPVAQCRERSGRRGRAGWPSRVGAVDSGTGSSGMRAASAFPGN